MLYRIITIQVQGTLFYVKSRIDMFCKNLHQYFLLTSLFAKIKTRKMKLVSIALALLLLCNNNMYSQNISIATNGLSKPADSIVALGGTLTQHTNIDLGASY